MEHINLPGPVYDNSELMSLLPILHTCAKRHRDHTDKDILKGAPNDDLRQALFDKYQQHIAILRDVLYIINHFQAQCERMADDMRGNEAVAAIIREMNLDQQKN